VSGDLPTRRALLTKSKDVGTALQEGPNEIEQKRKGKMTRASTEFAAMKKEGAKKGGGRSRLLTEAQHVLLGWRQETESVRRVEPHSKNPAPRVARGGGKPTWCKLARCCGKASQPRRTAEEQEGRLKKSKPATVWKTFWTARGKPMRLRTSSGLIRESRGQLEGENHTKGKPRNHRRLEVTMKAQRATCYHGNHDYHHGL